MLFLNFPSCTKLLQSYILILKSMKFKWLKIIVFLFDYINRSFSWLNNNFIYSFYHIWLDICIIRLIMAFVVRVCWTCYKNVTQWHVCYGYWPSKPEFLSLEIHVTSKYSSYYTLCQFARREYSYLHCYVSVLKIHCIFLKMEFLM